MDRLAVELRASLDGNTHCIEARGPKHSRGYRYLPGGVVLAHRAAYERATGETLGVDEVDHLCRNRACVNPAHLRRVPAGFNVRQGNAVRTAAQRAQTHCVNGHPYDEANTYWRPTGGRDCKVCINERSRRCKARKRGVVV